jgi:uncharacterized protein (DUF433 family)
MKRTIDLSRESESVLHDIAKNLGLQSEEEALQKLNEALLGIASFVHDAAHPGQHPDSAVRDLVTDLLARLRAEDDVIPIRSTPGVMGGDACIRKTRIAVWTLVDYKRQGLSDAELLAAFPVLNTADLVAAWDYYAAHSEQVDAQRKRHEDAA